MTEKEFKKLKVGDKVRIVAAVPKDVSSSVWNREGLMRKWLGKVMTIRAFTSDGEAHMVEDKKEWAGDGWFWFPELIACKVADAPPVIVEHLIKDRKTIVKLSTGKVGVANCSPEDKFDIYEGLRIATARAYGKTDKEIFGEEEPKVKEVKRDAKKGEYIKIVAPVWAFGLYEKGDILQVCKTGRKRGYVYCDGVQLGGINYSILPSEYVVLEGYQPKKK